MDLRRHVRDHEDDHRPRGDRPAGLGLYDLVHSGFAASAGRAVGSRAHDGLTKDDMHRLRPLAGRAGAWRPPSGGRPPQLRRVKMDAGSIHVVPGAATRRPRELEEVPMSIVGGLDIHRKQITFDYVDTETGEVRRGQICPADREHLAKWLARFAGQDAHFALEGCTGWRYVAGEIIAAGLTPHLADPAEAAHLRGPKRRAKTDRADARHQRMLLEQGRLPECWIPPPHVLECRALLETYLDLREQRTGWLQRLHATPLQ